MQELWPRLMTQNKWLRESGSVRRAEELARRMKAKSQQSPKPKTRMDQMRIVSEEIDKIQDELQESLNRSIEDENKKSQVKIIRSRRETRVTFVFKGGLEETEERFQKIYKSLK
jgi:hypothetical protein